MKIFTKYQAKELSSSNLAKRRKENYDRLQNLYKNSENARKIVDNIFEEIKKASEEGEFTAIIDVTIDFKKKNGLIKTALEPLLVDSLSHLGYSVSANSVENTISLWIDWFE